MTSKEHIVKLQEGVEPWNTWRDQNPGIWPDLGKADFRGAKLNGANLFGVHFGKANLYGANLCGANLCRANLVEANLSGADLHEVDLHRAKLVRANLFGTNFIKANLFGVDLREAILTGADLCETILSRAILTEAKLVGAILSGADLGGANFYRAGLTGAKLVRANLIGAGLEKADLSGADLSEANLSEADLSGTDLSGADLGGANFYRAGLREVDLSGADLGGANFTNATLAETVFVNVDLANVKGLDSCHHYGPSTIDHRTLARSSKLPSLFLQGCGLSDWEIEAAKLYQTGLTHQQITNIVYRVDNIRAETPIQFYSCFISYNHNDKSFARRLHNRLQGHGIRCWLDEHQMLPGDDIYEQVDHGIRLWDKVLLCCSKASLTSWWVDSEINKAFVKEQRLMKERGKKVLTLIPLNLDDYLFSKEWQSGKKEEVKSRLAANFTNWEQDNKKFEVQFERIVQALQTNEGAREKPPQSKL